MRCRSLGWAGVEVEHDGASLVIDALADPTATYAAVGRAAAGVTFPEIVSPQPEGDGEVVAGLITHLHRDHADAAALSAVLAAGARVLLPATGGGRSDGGRSDGGRSDGGISQARDELRAASLQLHEVSPWESLTIDPFTLTALPAADGTGEAQLSWAVAAGDHRVIHCGDTMFHGWWWRAAEVAGPFDVAFLPINGAVLNFPWCQPASPLPAIMTPEQAVHAARALGARTAVPIHFGGYDLEPFYRSIPDALVRFEKAAASAGTEIALLEPGETLSL